MNTRLTDDARNYIWTNEQVLHTTDVDTSNFPMSGRVDVVGSTTIEVIRRHGRRGIAIVGMLLLSGLGLRLLDPHLEFPGVWRGACFIADAAFIMVLAVIAIFVQQNHATNSEKARDMSFDIADDQGSARTNGGVT